jgi:hypothetical protein
VQFGIDDGNWNSIRELRDLEKIEWCLYLDLPSGTIKIPVFGQKEVLQLLPESGS